MVFSASNRLLFDVDVGMEVQTQSSSVAMCIRGDRSAGRRVFRFYVTDFLDHFFRPIKTDYYIRYENNYSKSGAVPSGYRDV